MESAVKTLWNNNFLLLSIGKIFSVFGNQVLTFVLPLYILSASGSPALFGIILGLSFLPIAITSPIGGIMADRLKKQFIMFWLDVAVALIIVIYMIISGISGAIAPIMLVKLLALNAIQGMYLPAVQASTPLLVPENALVRANSVIETVNTLANMAAPAAAGILLARFGLSPILVACAVCFVITAGMDLLIRIPYKKQETGMGMIQIVKTDMTGALRFVTKERPILVKMAVLMIVLPMFVASIFMVGVPVFITQYLGMGTEHIGIGRGIAWSGGIIGGLIAGALGERLTIKRVPSAAVFLALSLVPVGVVLLFDMPHLAAFVVIIAADTICGVALMLYMIPLWAYVQKITPPQLLGKVMSLLSALPIVSTGLGFLLTGVFLERLYTVPWLIVFVAAFICLVTVLFVRKHFREAESDA
ncbi:MAG: MFS transporter [Oscillospiraceae bacterium]|nr:MFS transporter [Oscillospiraceae bacterium]